MNAQGTPPNNELQRTSDGTAAGSPLNSVLSGRNPMGHEVREARLRGTRLEPANWKVCRAFSPFWSGWGGRWWALLVCDEGLAAFEWPRRKYWARQLRLGLTAGRGQPPAVDADSWPLTERSSPVEAKSAILYPRESIAAVEVKRRRFFTNELHVIDAAGQRTVYTIADPRNVEEYEAFFQKHYSRTGVGAAAG
jgi:hypothetical protein